MESQESALKFFPRLEEILENTHDAFFSVDGQWHITYVNKAAERFFQKDRKDLAGVYFWDLVPESSITTDHRMLRDVMEHRKSVRWEAYMPGLGLRTDVTVYPISDGGLTVQLRDIKEGGQYRSLFDSIDEGFCIIELIYDRDGNAVDCLYWDANPAFERQMGLSNVVGKRAKELFPRDMEEFAFTLRYYQHVAQTQTPVRFINKAKALNRWFDLFAFPTGQPGSNRIAVLFSDITAHKLRDQALHESERRALALVEELERADKNKNEFINILSHEFRNPLAAIDAWLQLAEMTGSTIDMLHAQGIIRRQVDQLARLTDDLLETSRVMNNKIVLRKENADLSQIAMRAVNDYLAQFDNRGIRLEFACTEESIPIFADPERITQAIGNLLHNALKFTQGGGRVQVSAIVKGDWAEISVCDNGIGIEPEALSLIFQPFMQANQSIDRKNGGLGIGLSIVKGVAELHGGSVMAKSDGPGRGSTFLIVLPLTQSESERAKCMDAKSRRQSFRILMIEDNRELADVVGTLLTLKGHRVMTAQDGREGIRIANEFSPEIVLCDIGLPEVNGFEVIEQIKGELTCKPFLIALSGYGSMQDIGLAQKAGFDLYLVKPVNMQTLLEAIDKAGQIPNCI